MSTDDTPNGEFPLDSEDRNPSCPACRRTFASSTRLEDHLSSSTHMNEVERLLKLPATIHRLTSYEIEWLSARGPFRKGESRPASARTNSSPLKSFAETRSFDTAAAVLAKALCDDKVSDGESASLLKSPTATRGSDVTSVATSKAYGTSSTASGKTCYRRARNSMVWRC